jgi:glycosyltransferase involved in cell wall biosynthesis
MTDCLSALEKYNSDKNIRIVALVNSRKFFNIANVKYIEFPKSKKSWFYRLYYEYFYFKKLSRQLNADIWFSMHDLSPNVVAKKKFVYYHNPSPFYKLNSKEWLYGFKIGLFSQFYKYIAKINIKSNNAVFVQQYWIKNSFEKWFSISNCKVAYPEINFPFSISNDAVKNDKIQFFYPSFPRMFKNFECICEAVLLLPKEIQNKIEINFTISGKENWYSKSIFKKYSKHEFFHFLGNLSREKVADYYSQMDCLLFPSKLETWGLPLTETKKFNKPIVVADLPYAKETIGEYDKVSFFNPNKPSELAEKMLLFVEKKIIFDATENPKKPHFIGWDSVFDFIFTDKI